MSSFLATAHSAKKVDFLDSPSIFEVQCPLMPTALRTGPYRFFFYSNEGDEPPHVHVERDASYAKFWLNPVTLAGNYGFSAKELRKLEALTQENKTVLLEAWNGHFGVSG